MYSHRHNGGIYVGRIDRGGFELLYLCFITKDLLAGECPTLIQVYPTVQTSIVGRCEKVSQKHTKAQRSISCTAIWLCLTLKGEGSANLVSSLIEVLGVEGSTETESAAGAELDVVGESSNATVVDLGL